ncbi:glutathione peroxidase [Pseudomonas lalucatii]|nr:glutathione peroxidase [Pseudomonas lalucatii]
MSQSLYDIPLKSIEGSSLTLEPFKGKVLLVVNVASKCGLTPQYEGLEALYEEKRAQGFEVLGFPANDFSGQEPGSDEEIQAFCSLNYKVQFPLFAKIAVTGAEQHPLYSALTAACPTATGDGPMRERLKGYGIEPEAPPAVQWNFEKFLISREGRVVGRFAPDIAADDPGLRLAIDAQLNLTP